MPPPRAARPEREKKIKVILAFAASLTDRIASTPTDPALVDELQTHIESLCHLPSPKASTKHSSLNTVGIDLWNFSTRLKRNETIGSTSPNRDTGKKVLSLLRVFAFLLLHESERQRKKGPDKGSCFSLMRTSLKAAWICLDNEEYGCAFTVLERSGYYENILAKLPDEGAQGEEDIVARLRAEYFLLRTVLAWRQDRLDLAEHFFWKINQFRKSLDAATGESAANLLYEIGKSYLQKHIYEVAVRWLERAHELLGEQDVGNLSPDAGELKLAIGQALAQGYMKLGTTEDVAKAWQVVSLLETDYPDKMAVSVLKLELLSSEEAIDVEQYAGVLRRMIRTIILTEVNFKTIMHHIHKLREQRVDAACKCLTDLIEIRLLPPDEPEWLEKALITRIWAISSDHSSDEVIDPLKELFNTLVRTKNALSVSAIHAAQTLLWKRAEAACSVEQYRTAESWCHLALHPLFDRAGELNKTRISRKLIACAISRQDEAMAREIFSNMAEHSQNEPLTRYLMYKLAINSKDSTLAAECLDHIFRQSTEDTTLLYSCVLEAQNSGDRRLAIMALEKVIEKCENKSPPGAHLPALFRSTVKLLLAELSEGDVLNPDLIEELCKVLETAAAQAKASRRRPTTPEHLLFTKAEFEWFSKNTYNFALGHCANLHPSSLARLLRVCIEFIKLLDEQDRSDADTDLLLRKMFCDFMAACAYTTLARSEDSIETCLQYYLAVRQHSQAFRNTLNTRLHIDHLGDSAKDDAIAKYFQVIKLELEAALKLEDWEGLDQLFDECWRYENPGQWETLADLVIVIHSCLVNAHVDKKHEAKALEALQNIINIRWRQGNQDMVSISRWIRCLFQLALTFDEDISQRCIEQATDMASKSQGTGTPFPSAEIEWLATTAFNHAVDHYIVHDDERCKLWAEKALTLAGYAEDAGLKELLVSKYSGLVWK